MPFITGPESLDKFSKESHSHPGPPMSDVVAILPMTRSQEGLWLAYLMSPHTTPYNLTLKFSFRRLNKDYDSSLDALYRAITILTKRHAMLRSTFHNAAVGETKPFVAEHDPTSASPVLQIISKSNAPRAEDKISSLLRTATNLSTTFAARWCMVVGAEETELFLVCHHIAVDGQSMSHISKELLDLVSMKPGTKLNLSPDTELQPFHRAYILENEFLSSVEYDLAKAFWLCQSRNVRPVKWKVALPVKPTASRKNYREIQNWMNISDVELRSWGGRYNTSWFRVAVALIGVLIRSVAEPDGGADHAAMIAFGGRPAGMEKSVGQFANAVPIRIPLAEIFTSRSPTFKELVQVVSQTISTAKKHERLPYLDVIEAYREAALTVPPPQIAITFSPKLSRPECSLYPVEGVYDLFFCFQEGHGSVSLDVIYNPLIFSSEDINRLKDEFAWLHRLSVDDVQLHLPSLPFLRPHFPHILADIRLDNAQEINLARFHSLFEIRAAQDPGLLALHSAEQGRSITYQKLNEEANRKAHHLRGVGISRESVVLIHLSRGFQVMEWIIAALKSGAAFVVADQMRPVNHTKAVISIAKPTIIVDDGQGQDLRKQSAELHIKILDVRETSFADMPKNNLEDITRADDLAYISFTSGSTGQPKGVEIEHRNLSHFILNAYSSNYVLISPGSRVLQWATFAFDAAVIEWAQCLTLGGTLCFSDVPQVLIGDYLADVIDANEISFINVTASVLATLPTSRPLPSLRQISVGGEMVPESLLRVWRTRVQVQNAYGPTECTAVMSHHPQPGSPNEPQPPAGIIGRPHRHMNFFVSNDDFTRILAVNEIGEVCIAGPQVGRGYRGREDLTSSRFAIHPELGVRMYRTGDRGKLLADGSVLLVGRMDREVKLRGYRLELDSVERIIYETMPQISAVSLQIDESGPFIRAFVAPQNVSVSELKGSFLRHLPHYMVPDVVHALNSLPLNANGKVDHKAIKANMGDLAAKAMENKEKILAPTHTTLLPRYKPSELESHRDVEAIAKLWERVLDLTRRPNYNENFFDLGGNSLSIQTLLGRIKAEFPAAGLTIMDLFANPTIQMQSEAIRRLTSVVENSTSTASITPLPEYSSSGDEGVESIIIGIWRTVLGASELGPHTKFFDVGGNSLSASLLLANIHLKWPKTDIKVVDLFHHVTPRSQAALISERLWELIPPELDGQSQLISEAANAISLSPSGGREIAIIGLAGRFPGSSNPDELYRLLLEERDGMTVFPEPSSSAPPFKDGIYVPKRGVIPDVEKFDHVHWGIKEDEARDMDPQQRLFLDVTREALEDARQFPSSDGFNSIGLSVGAAHDTWSSHHKPPYDGDKFTKTYRASTTPSISARTAYHLNFHGPNVTLNTACSSGLVAMSLAVDQLRTGQCDMSIAGGVSITFPQQGYFTMNGQLLSQSGECRPFDHRADGTIPGDAVCAIVLRRLDDAVRDGDKVYAVISGIAIGSDGNTEKAGPLAPSARGQANTIVRAWKDSGLSASKLVYAELHGSGTLIGDAIELEGFNIARRELGEETTPVVVGSNKGNLGNCEAAGGLVSVIKMCKSMEKGVIPPIHCFEKLNPLVNSPLTVATSKVSLSPHDAVSVSSIGLGGVNAHCILRSPPTNSHLG